MKKKIEESPKEIEVKLIFKELPSNRILGLRMDWITGKHKKKEFALSSGCGVGNSGLSFTYKGKSYSTNIQDILGQLIIQIDKK